MESSGRARKIIQLLDVLWISGQICEQLDDGTWITMFIGIRRKY